MKKLLPYIILLILSSCSSSKWQVVEMSGVRIPLDSAKESLADPAFKADIQIYKDKIDATMNEVLAVAEKEMRSYQPESPLSNLTADVYRLKATEILGTKVDLGLANLGGLRTYIPAGNITLGKVFEVMPFKNELEIVWLKGKFLQELLDQIAAQGGQGISGLTMHIENGKAVDILIDNIPLESEKEYTIATNNFVAQGNDHLEAILNRTKIRHSGETVRDIFIEYLRKEKAAGRKIVSNTDERIIED